MKRKIPSIYERGDKFVMQHAPRNFLQNTIDDLIMANGHHDDAVLRNELDARIRDWMRMAYVNAYHNGRASQRRDFKKKSNTKAVRDFTHVRFLDDLQ